MTKNSMPMGCLSGPFCEWLQSPGIGWNEETLTPSDAVIRWLSCARRGDRSAKKHFGGRGDSPNEHPVVQCGDPLRVRH